MLLYSGAGSAQRNSRCVTLERKNYTACEQDVLLITGEITSAAILRCHLFRMPQIEAYLSVVISGTLLAEQSQFIF